MRSARPWAGRVYAAFLLLLPGWLRRRAGAEMLATCEDRLASARSRSERLLVLIHELGGLVSAAVRSRREWVPARSRTPASGRVGRRPLLDGLREDLRMAGRSMVRRPSVALLAIGTLGLGIGSSTAMFSVIDGALLRPLPFDSPGQLFIVHTTFEELRGDTDPGLGAGWDRGFMSAAEYVTWLDQQRTFETAGAFSTGGLARIPIGAGSEAVPVTAVTPSLFETLRVRPVIGRLFSEQEPEAAVVLSYSFWQHFYSGDEAVIGADILVSDQPVRVVGVLPSHIEFPGDVLPGFESALFRPLGLNPTNLRNHNVRVVGRLRPDVSVAAAEAEAGAILGSLASEDPGHSEHSARLVPPLHDHRQSARTPLLILLAASLVLLLAGCANVALLLLGAGAQRARELAFRGALGATRGRLAAQLLVESLVLAAAAAATGLVLAIGITRLLVALAPPGLPGIQSVTVDVHAFGFAAALGLATGLVAGSLPALTLSRVRAALVLRGGTAPPGSGHVQRAMVATCLGLATVLLIGSGLLTRTMQELNQVQPGFEPDGLLAVKLLLPLNRIQAPGTPFDLHRHHQYVERVREAVAALPGVEGVALASVMPFSREVVTAEIEAEDQTTARSPEPVETAIRSVSGNYMEVLRVPVLYGRGLAIADEHPAAEPVAVVNERFARRFWPDASAIGRTVRARGVAYRVVGVVADVREQDIRGDPDALKLYEARNALTSGGSTLILRSDAAVAAMGPAVRNRLWAVDDALVIQSLLPMRERMADSMAEYRYRMLLMVSFSALATLFALLGIYGAASSDVTRRRQELGIRVALGARRLDVLGLILRRSLLVACTGAAVGLVAGVAASRVLESMLWGVRVTDVRTLAGVVLTVLSMAIVASVFPARRAVAVQPTDALRI